jgi:AcrR family transcriptional regulator
VTAVNIRVVTTPGPGLNEPHPYHHGNLRAALIDAGVELARAGGPDSVTLREACRQVGVSHTAAYRHFSDRNALLAAVADAAMAILAELMERLIDRADGPDPGAAAEAGLRATGRAYIRFAINEPGLFRTAFAVPEHHGDPLAAAAPDAPTPGPLGLLGRSLDRLQASGAMAPERRPNAEVTAWSAVHGLSMLLLEGPLRSLPEQLRDDVIERVLDDVGRGLTTGSPGDISAAPAVDGYSRRRPDDEPQ